MNVENITSYVWFSWLTGNCTFENIPVASANGFVPGFVVTRNYCQVSEIKSCALNNIHVLNLK